MWICSTTSHIWQLLHIRLTYLSICLLPSCTNAFYELTQPFAPGHAASTWQVLCYCKLDISQNVISPGVCRVASTERCSTVVERKFVFVKQWLLWHCLQCTYIILKAVCVETKDILLVMDNQLWEQVVGICIILMGSCQNF